MHYRLARRRLTGGASTPLLSELGGIRVELRLAGLRAEVISLSLILASSSRFGWIDLHATHNVLLHDRYLLSVTTAGPRRTLSGF